MRRTFQLIRQRQEELLLLIALSFGLAVVVRPIFHLTFWQSLAIKSSRFTVQPISLLSCRRRRAICLGMRNLVQCCVLICLFALVGNLQAAKGKLIKALPHFMDQEGRVALTPSLYDRDAYQAVLRKNPGQRSGVRFDIQWNVKGPVWQPLRLRLELRGVAQGALPREKVLEQTVEKKGWLNRWTSVELKGKDYEEFGEITAWRVTLWEGDWPLSEIKSFLW